MAEKGFTDTDKGMKKALEEMKKLGKMWAKVGWPDNGDSNSDGVRLAQIAAINENGATSTNNVLKKGKVWVLPPRPFLSQAIDNNEEQEKITEEKLVKQMFDGKIDAKTVMRLLCENRINNIKNSIKNGNFAPNSEITINGIIGKDGKVFIRGKKSTKPLVNTGMMRDALCYQIFEGNAMVEEGGKKPG
ncbi:MAG: hypothetical protein LBH43_07175 [Treponema sp.]|jgi:hypothetical protein|nr:hypothetical protein [Treponema sp.]